MSEKQTTSDYGELEIVDDFGLANRANQLRRLSLPGDTVLDTREDLVIGLLDRARLSFERHGALEAMALTGLGFVTAASTFTAYRRLKQA